MRSILDKTPPHSIEAEICTLGSMIIDNNAIDRVVEILRAEDFYRDVHRILFETILSLKERNEAVDIVTVKEDLIRRNQLQAVGGLPFLTEIMESVPSAANAENYARIVADKSVLRKLQDAGHKIISLSEHEDENIQVTIDAAEQVVFNVAQRRLGNYFTPVQSVIGSIFDRLDEFAQQNKDIIGIPSGYHALDSITAGFQKADLIILAARPSMGKTSLALSFALNAALRENSTVAIFSLEMSKEQLVQRMMSTEAEINGQKLRTARMNDEEWKALTRVCDKLYNAKIYIDDTVDISSLEMRSKARRLKSEHDLDLIIVDYLQLMRSSKRTENRVQEISEIARSLKALARDLQVPVIALSQLSRAVEHRENRRPMLSDLRESGSIEAEADLVMLIYREAYYQRKEVADAEPEPTGVQGYEHTDVTEIIIAKQRNGPVGTIKLGFQPAYARFLNFAHDE